MVFKIWNKKYLYIVYNCLILLINEVFLFEGYDEYNDEKGSLKDQERIDCHVQHLSHIHSAML